MTTEYKSKTGPIPDDAFENDMGAPDPKRTERMMSKADRDALDADVAATLARVKKMREGK